MRDNLEEKIDSFKEDLSKKFHKLPKKFLTASAIVGLGLGISYLQHLNYMSDDEVSAKTADTYEVVDESRTDNSPVSQEYILEVGDFPKKDRDEEGMETAKECFSKTPIEYEVKQGDTLWDVASEFSHVEVDDIRDYNTGSLNNLTPGDVLSIPPYVTEECKNNTKYNRDYIKTLSGEEVQDIRFNFGVEGLGELLGVQPGICSTTRVDIQDLRRVIEHASTLYGVDVNTLDYIVSKESSYSKFCISKTGALGPFGLTSWVYGRDINFGDNNDIDEINPFNYDEAAYRAAEYFNYLENKFGKILNERGIDESEEIIRDLSLASYNQGPDRVRWHLGRVLEGSNKTLDNFIDELSVQGTDYVKDYENHEMRTDLAKF